ncbi:hypothetical protein BI364_16985 [Acidihalobacter yilgarnensis]|uniref:Methyltransferase FkbM domain-containing protein n=1 Tax=Acidihalobacter yilgarnensis TaxID=2819280 RepID=A0A1D8ISM1_9GAMM|nr:FkbM family methyltransferase [Acidihalobacter yilgarnensis]AOU99395.1 hypothetical protein BI364_16985 [Acidihalobacter yilgarnensis]
MRGMVKRTAEGIIARMGYRLIPEWQLKDADYARHLEALFDLLDIRCVLDVGANKGQYRDFLRRRVGYEGLILSFEPVHELASALSTRAREDEQWEVFEFALGEADTEQTLNVMATSVFSSFLEPDHSVVQDFAADNVLDHKENVGVKRLDTFMAEMSGTREFGNTYLKMDTQGYDLNVLRGARESLRNIRALQSEVSVLGIYTGMPGYMESIEAIRESGFDVTGLFPVTRDDAMRVIEFDCVAVNRGLLAQTVDTTIVQTEAVRP